MLKRLRGWYLACLVAALALYAGGLALNVSTDEATLGSGFVNWVQGLPSIGGGTGSGGGSNNGGGSGGGTTNNGGGNNGNGGTTNNGGNNGTGTNTNTGGTGTTTGVMGTDGPTGKSADVGNEAPEELIDEDHGLRYALMDATSRAHYDDMLPHLRDREASFRVSGMSWDDVGTIFNAIRLDHPELFWLHTYSGQGYGGEYEVTLVASTYL